nr:MULTISPECIES: RHS repeat-associated core domain-containing protein [unclassified Lysobacter]
MLVALTSIGAVAQETEKVWSTSDAVGSPFISEHEAQEAIKRDVVDNVPDGPMLKFRSEGNLILKDRTLYWYGITPMPPKTGEWDYSFIMPRVFNAPSMDSAVAQTKAYYDKESVATGCAPNTTVLVHPSSQRTFWDDGVTLRQEFFPVTVVYQSGLSGTCTPITFSGESYGIGAGRSVGCPSYLQWDPQKQACAGGGLFASGNSAIYSAPVLAPGQCKVGNPCDPSTGDKMQPETDFDLGWISFTRYFHSLTSTPMGGFGDGWTHSHNLRLTAGKDPTSWDDTVHVGLVEADGSQISFTPVGDVYESDDGRGDRAVKDGDQWWVYRSDRVLRFDADGRLLEQRFESGASLTYAYDAVHRLSTITHSSGRSLAFDYAASDGDAPIAAIRSSGRALATYGYTAAGQIETATYANSTNRRYHYEDTRFPRYLTGVTIEGDKRFSTFVYDAKGRVISSQHDGGADGVTLSYPEEGGSLITNALGQQTTLGLGSAPPSDAPRKISDLTDSRGTAGTTYYDEETDFRRRVATTTDRKGIVTEHAYTEANDPVTGLLARTHTVTEAKGKPQQRISVTVTDVASNRPILAKVGSQETRIVRNARLQPASMSVRDTVSNEVRTTTYAYCEAADVTASNSTCPVLGLLKSVDGPRTDVNDVTHFEYYGSDDSVCAATPELCTYRKGDLRKTIDALGRATEIIGYDPDGHPLSVVDANGLVTDFTYNPRGWLTATKVRGTDDTTQQDDRITEIAYYLDGPVQTVTLPSQAPVYFDYDKARRLNSINASTGDRIDYTLDNAGNIKKQENRTGSGQLTHTLSRVYDALGQLITAKDASQNPTSFTYDANGNAELITDALGRKTSQSYDSLNRLSETLQDVGGLAVKTVMTYNALDQVTKVTDPKGLNTVYAYNGFGDQTKLTSPDTGITDYTYNAAGLPATKKDANDAAAHRYTYDALNRPTAIFYTATGPADVEYDYDAVNTVCATDETFVLGRVTAMRAEGTQLQYCYDRFGQVVRKVQTVAGKSFTLRYAYNKTGLLQAVTYPDGAVADYWRDNLGRILEIYVTPAGGVRTKLLYGTIYQPFGPSLGWTYGNDRYVMIDSDLDYRTKSIRDIASGGLSLGYVYNQVGEIKELKDGLLGTSLAQYDYDALSRLRVTRDGPTSTAIETYEYDLTGNRKKLIRGTVQEDYVYPAANHRLSSINIAGGSTTSRSYDAIGNTIAIGGTAKVYAYNANDRLAQVKQAGVVKASYRYNALGERVAATNGTSSIIDAYTLYDERGNWIGDYDANGVAKQQAIWFDGIPVGLLVGSGSTQSLKYVQTDHLGTPRAVIDPTRNVAIWTWDAKNEAFGNSPPNQDPDLDGTAFVFNMRFPGQRFDTGSGFVYNYFRDYDPASGRYLQSDPIGLAGGFDTYSYVGSNPVQFIDPNGLQSRDLEYIYKESGATPPPPGNLNFAGWMLAEALCGFCDLSYTAPEGLQSIDAPWEMGFGVRGLSNAAGRATARAAASCKVFKNLAPEDDIIPAVLFKISDILKVKYSGRLTYVVRDSGELIVGRTPHTSLARGADVIAAGEARFVNGELRSIDNASGHYRPSGESARDAAEAAFNRAGLNASGKYTERKF